MRFLSALCRAACAVVLLGDSVGCKRKPAARAACDDSNHFVCADARSALYCAASSGATSGNSAFVAVECEGPLGCGTSVEKGARCDDSVATEGAACMAEDGHACNALASSSLALVCKGHVWRAWRACKGSGGCTIDAEGAVVCDDTVGDVGDPCGASSSGACSSDGASLLACHDGALDVRASCRGKARCAVSAATHSLDCDRTAAGDGDACDEPDAFTCSVDRTWQLLCKGRVWMKDKECKRKGGCENPPGQALRCAW